MKRVVTEKKIFTRKIYPCRTNILKTILPGSNFSIRLIESNSICKFEIENTGKDIDKVDRVNEIDKIDRLNEIDE